MKKGKVCVFDIDGVMNYYPQTWINFVNSMMGENFDTLYEMKNSISYSMYKTLKEKYRLSGIKREQKPRRGLIGLINCLKDNGWIVVIVSARPVIKYPTLYEQTRGFLDDNGIQYDNLIFSKEKQFDILKMYPNMQFMVEDNRLVANLLSDLGFKVYLLDNYYNRGQVGVNVKRVSSLEELFDDVEI